MLVVKIVEPSSAMLPLACLSSTNRPAAFEVFHLLIPCN